MTEDNNKPVMEIDDYGDKYWWLNGNLHREDGPAVEFADGDNYWLLNGKRHREDGPAIEYADGSKEWWLNDELHREDGPAIEWADGDKEWYLNGKLHKAWYLNDKEVTKEEVMGSKEEPIMEIDEYGNKVWKLNGKIHREDGPAIEFANGDKWCLNEESPDVKWYFKGKEIKK